MVFHIGTKLSKIQQFMKKLHQVLASTYKSEELEMILRDLDEIAQGSGLELFNTQPISKLKNKMSHEDRISASMFRTKNEINSIKSLEEEREFKNLIEKLSIVDLSKRLQDLLQDIEEITAYEKKMLIGQINQYKEVMDKKEKKYDYEIKALQKERNEILARFSTLDLEDEDDKRKLKTLMNDIQKDRDDKIATLQDDSKVMHSYTVQQVKALDEEAAKEPVKLRNEGRYKALLSNSKKQNKTQQLSSTSKGDITINNSIRKETRKTKVTHTQGWK